MGDLPIFTIFPSFPIISHLFPWFTVAVGRSSLPKAQQEKLTMGLKAAAVIPLQFFWKHERIMEYQDEPGINHGFLKWILWLWVSKFLNRPRLLDLDGRDRWGLQLPVRAANCGWANWSRPRQECSFVEFRTGECTLHSYVFDCRRVHISAYPIAKVYVKVASCLMVGWSRSRRSQRWPIVWPLKAPIWNRHAKISHMHILYTHTYIYIYIAYTYAIHKHIYIYI